MSAEKCDEHSRIVGTKQLIKFMEQDKVDTVVLARDAESHVTGRILELARTRAWRSITWIPWRSWAAPAASPWAPPPPGP